MFEELKKQHPGGVGQERARLTIFVAACVLMAGVIVGTDRCASSGAIFGDDDQDLPIRSIVGGERTRGPVDQEGAERAPDRLDPEVLLGHIRKPVAGPDGSTEQVETTDRWVDEALKWARSRVRAEPGTLAAERILPSVLAAQPLEESIGRLYEVDGLVVERVEQVWMRDTLRLWAILLRDDAGGRTLAVTLAPASEPGGGAPRDTYRGAGAQRPIEVGNHVLVRGYLVQRRTGSVGEILLDGVTPVVHAHVWTLAADPDEREAPAGTLDEIPWASVKDRYLEETRDILGADAIYRTIQWARAQGHDRLLRRLRKEEAEDGTALPPLAFREWDQKVFAGAWSTEVEAKPDTARPFTEHARGHVFRTTGLIANWAFHGWDDVPQNPFGVEGFAALDLYSDHHSNVVIRTISAFPLSTYGDIALRKNAHVRVYGVFVKNHTYDKAEAGEDTHDVRAVTVPLFVVIHVEARPPLPSAWANVMLYVTGSLLVLGLLFWLVVVRGERREARRHAERRVRIRQSQRAALGGGASDEKPDAASGEGARSDDDGDGG